MHLMAPKSTVLLPNHKPEALVLERPAAQSFGNELRLSGSIASGDQKTYGAVCVGTCALTNTTRLQQGPVRARTYWARSHRSQEPQHSAASSAQVTEDKGTVTS